MEHVAHHDFVPAPFPVRSFLGGGKCRYRVYRKHEEFVPVQAETAADAMKLSGILSPERIIREVPGTQVLIESRELLEDENSEPAAPSTKPVTDAAPVEAAPAEPAAETAAEPTAETPPAGEAPAAT